MTSTKRSFHPRLSQTGFAMLLVFSLCALAVMCWRWGGTIEDSQAYFDTVRYLRHELPLSALQAPFPYRIGVPALVAIMPFDARATFAFLNWIFVVLAAFTLSRAVSCVYAELKIAYAAGLLLILSFSTYWYAPYLLVDPGSLFARACFVYGILSGRTKIAEASGLIATIIREENILLTVWLIFTRRISIVRGAALLMISVVWLIVVRWYIIQGLPSYVWSPSLNRLIAAIHDWKSLSTITATIGIVVPLAIWGWSKAPARISELKSLALFMVAPIIYAALSVRIDGRAVWGLYPFLIPFAVLFFKQYKETLSHQ